MFERVACQLCGTVFPLGPDGLPPTGVSYPKIWSRTLLNPTNPVEFFTKREDLFEKDDIVQETEDEIKDNSNDTEGSKSTNDTEDEKS